MELKLFFWEVSDHQQWHMGLVWAKDEEAAKVAGFALCDAQFSMTLRGDGAQGFGRQYDRVSELKVEQGGPAVLFATLEE